MIHYNVLIYNLLFMFMIYFLIKIKLKILIFSTQATYLTGINNMVLLGLILPVKFHSLGLIHIGVFIWFWAIHTVLLRGRAALPL
jgi:hypothetical protein